MGIQLDKRYLFDDTRVYLKDRDLKVGKVYVFKDNRLAIYMGRDIIGKYVFYQLINILLVGGGYLAYGQVMHDINVKTCNELFSKGYNKHCITMLKGLPKLKCEYPDLDFSSKLGVWKSKIGLMGESFPVLVNEEKKVTSADLGYVGARELEFGRVYTTTESGWRSTYIYMGRRYQLGKKGFAWAFVGNEHVLRENKKLFMERYFSLDITYNNKKVKLREDMKDIRIGIEDLFPYQRDLIDEYK